MARALTSPELALLRSDTQFSKLYLAIYKPNTIYTALLNGVPASNDRVYQITYDGGSGTLANVKVGMTLYVGTVAGAYDLGMCRIRKTPGASTFYIGLTSEITWADNCYLTVVDDFDLWAKHAVVTTGELAMDVDIAYSDQHADFSPVAVLGSHAVVWLDAATVDVDFDASDSWVIGSSISTYAWTAPGASATSGLSTATPTLTYDTPGCYSVYCTVTAANGKSMTGVRHVFVYDRDAHQPTTVFQLAQCVGDYDTGGYMFDMVMEAEASLSEIHDRALVVLFAEDWYGTTKQSIGPVLNRENIVCMGRIVGESIRWDQESGLVHFSVQGLQHWLNKVKAFPVELTFVGEAASWSEMPTITVDRVLHHILYWHSTALETMDFYPINSALYVPNGKTIASTIWGQIQDIAVTREMASAGVDPLGRLFVEIDPQMVPEADRDWATVMALTSGDWENSIEFGRVTVPDCSLISLSTHEVDAAGTVSARYSLSPGHVPLRYGEPEMGDWLLCASQADANQKAGLLLGWRINPYPDVPVTLAMNNRMIGLFPRQFCSLVVATQNTPREIAFDGNLIPRRVALYFDADAGYMHPEINFEAETFEQIAVNGDVPESEDYDMSVPPSYSAPDLPSFDFPLPGFEPVSALGPSTVLVHEQTLGLCLSRNFSATSPTWITWNTGMTTAQYQDLNHIVKCPNGVLYATARTANLEHFIARAASVGAPWVIVMDAAAITALHGTTAYVTGLAANPNAPESLIMGLGDSNTHLKLYRGSSSSWTLSSALPGDGQLIDMSFYGNQLVCTWDSSYRVLSADGVTTVRSGTHGNYLTRQHVRGGATAKILHWNYPSSGIVLSLDNDTTFETPITDFSTGNFYSDRTTGTYFMSGSRHKCSDGGYTWVSISTLPVQAQWFFDNAGNGSRWVAAASYLYYTEDFWNSSPINKAGNLTTLNPLFHCDLVKVLAI